MRTEINGNVTVVYPDALVAAFARNPITVEGYTGTAIELIVTGGSKTMREKRSLFGDGCFFDLAYYLQMLFSDMFPDVDYTAIAANGLSAKCTVTLDFYNGITKERSTSFNVVAVWAYQIHTGDEVVKMFEGFPFTVGVVTTNSLDKVSVDGVETPLNAVGSFNIPMAGEGIVRLIHTLGSTVIISKTIKVVKECGNGIYLRWIDRTGTYRYWVFKQGNVTTDVNNNDEFIRKNTGTDFGKRRSDKKVGTSMEVCAPLVDGDTFAFLLEVAVSPVVDMYSEGKWLPVNIEGGSIVRERETRQDFIVNVVLPDTIVQKL